MNDSVSTSADDIAPPAPHPTFGEAARLWLKVGLLSFGGATAQIAMLHRFVVDERKWLDEQRFLQALNFCMLLPGPEAQQLATYIGWMLHGVRGGFVAGVMFVLPGAAVMLALCFLYALGQGIPAVDGLFLGIKCAVLAIIVEAMIRIGRRALKGALGYAIAIGAFLALLLLEAPFPLIVLGAASIAAALGHARPNLLGLKIATRESSGAGWREKLAVSARFAIVGLVAWFLPVVVAALFLGPQHILVDLGLFFSKLAMLTFGGAYALLAWLAQAAVEQKGWVTAPEMLDGLGLAETTPGPTILVNQFVGFLAALRSPAPFSPLLAGTLGALMVVWTTFAPSFVWIFAGAPFVEDLQRNRRVTAALAGVTAAVVGVVAYLALWFALNVLFSDVRDVMLGPFRLIMVDPGSGRLPAMALSAVAFALMLVWHQGLAITLAVCAAMGVALKLAGVV
ncbi:MAG: chromate efflux transporter [Beijerinckiaceae bacterium]